jgi:hypothetical protein
MVFPLINEVLGWVKGGGGRRGTLNFYQLREKLRSENFSRSAPGGELRSPDPGFAGVMPLRGMPGAFCTGIVKNQHRENSNQGVFRRRRE